MQKIEFLNTNIFYISGLFLVFLAFYFLYKSFGKKKLAIEVPFLEDLQKASSKAGIWKNKKIAVVLKWVFFVISIALLSVALARPQSISSENKISKNGVDILIALDVSESMLAEDLKPNRIEAAKKYISDFVSKLKTDRVGLEVFAGKPFTQSPLSFDYNVIRYYLSEISTDSIDQRRSGLGGTAIGDAILSAVNRFKNSKERTKVLILLTDGEANVGTDPIFAAEHARTNGIKIYTIGLGKKDGAPVPIKTKNGQKIYARNPDGSLFKAAFDEKTLKDVAKISGGEYFWAGSNNALKKSLEKISRLEKKEYEAETVVNKKDLFWIWLLFGFLSMSFSIFLLFFTQEVKIKEITLKK